MSIDFSKAKQALEAKVNKETAKRYETYFDTLRPSTLEDKFRRGLFALSSVHTTWQLNCALYSQLWDLSWLHDPELLKKKLTDSRAGLMNGRFKAFSQFAAFFWQFPGWIDKKKDEDWYAYVDRVKDTVHGLGPAKASFLAELLYFHDNRAVCCDTHMLQMYGVPAADVGKVKPIDMARIQTHWDGACAYQEVAPVTARWVLWDQKQGQQDSRYWSIVLEGEPAKMRKVEQLELKVA